MRADRADQIAIRSQDRKEPTGRYADLIRQGIEQATRGDSEETLAETCQTLSENPESTLEAAGEWWSWAAANPDLRWAVIYVLSLQPPRSSIQFFLRKALDPIPERDREVANVCETTRDGEVLVRIMATEALARCVGVEDTAEVVEALLQVVQGQAEPAVQAEAVVQLLDVDESRADGLRKLLPKEQRHFVELRPVDHPEEVAGATADLDLGEGSPPPQLDDQKDV